MFVNKYLKFYKKLISVVAIYVGIIIQSTIASGTESNNHIDDNKIQELNKSLYNYYKEQGSSRIIGDIYTDFSIKYTDIITFDPTRECFKNFRGFLRDRASNNPQLIGTVGLLSLNNGILMGIEIFSTTLFASLKHNFDALEIPTLEKFGLTKENFSEFSKMMDVCEGTYEIVADDKKIALHANNLYDSIGVVVQGADNKNEKFSLLANYHREYNVSEFIKVLTKKFDSKNTKISLISARYTPHLFEFINILKENDFTIKGYYIKDTHHSFMDRKYVVSVWPLSFEPIDLSPTGVLVIPGNDNIFFSEK